MTGDVCKTCITLSLACHKLIAMVHMQIVSLTFDHKFKRNLLSDLEFVKMETKWLTGDWTVKHDMPVAMFIVGEQILFPIDRTS